MFKNEATIAAENDVVVSEEGGVLWRNNVGALFDKFGRLVRFGLHNETKEDNKRMKSSDSVGIFTITVTPEMVGKKIGVFIAVESKKSDWKFSTKCKRSVAQKDFHDFVNQCGGIGCFSNNSEVLRNYLKGLIA